MGRAMTLKKAEFRAAVLAERVADLEGTWKQIERVYRFMRKIR